ncbi:MAG: tryptophan 7-halogenase [Qipengyuania sp.]|nr:tryptophan 7-halogenase [Qipengyuania sp.]
MVGTVTEAAIERVVIVGGGTAGWLSAATLAARLPHLSIALVEAPDIPTVGVGEGTWPTMRETLRAIGIAEGEFLAECGASFKQGSRFDGWTTGAAGDSYFHPFTPPPLSSSSGGVPRALLAAWREDRAGASFAETMSAQAAACARDLAPRQRAMPEYSGALNYAYHLDAGAFARLLARHATGRLGVRHVAGEVVAVEAAENGDVAAVRLRGGEKLTGELFLDCSGHAALLIGGHCAVRWVDRSDASPNDRALAVQVPVLPGSAIASQTVATAHEAGWLWDIGLPSRRGIGCVYSSGFLGDERADAILRDYVRARVPGAGVEALAPRLLRFGAGHRDSFWRGNVIAIGQAAGFIEPLEASAIVMVELSLRALVENFPASRAVMDVHARRFDALFRYRWDRIVDFLKLHYALSRRDEPYWRAQRDPAGFSPTLADQLALWRDQPPSAWDLPQVDEVFSAASQAYVYYGMGLPVPERLSATPDATARLAEVRARERALAASLPTNRAYLDAATAQAA